MLLWALDCLEPNSSCEVHATSDFIGLSEEHGLAKQADVLLIVAPFEPEGCHQRLLANTVQLSSDLEILDDLAEDLTSLLESQPSDQKVLLLEDPDILGSQVDLLISVYLPSVDVFLILHVILLLYLL